MRLKLPLLGLILVGAVALGLGACNSGAQPGKLPAVAALPKPSLPPWIASVSPLAQADGLSQIRVIFKKPVTKVEALSGNGPSDVLSHVSITPPLRGHFVVLTPRMIGFVAEQALPLAARVRVTLSAGLRDLDGDTLPSDLSWTFQTSPLQFTGLPQLPTSTADASPE